MQSIKNNIITHGFREDISCNVIQLASGSALDDRKFIKYRTDLFNLYIFLLKHLAPFNLINFQRKQLFDKKIWNLSDLMEATKFSRQTIYNMVSKGRIPHSKRGRRLFFSPTEILNWIQEGELE